MKLQTVLLIVALVAVVVFLIRRARHSSSRGYQKRFDSTLPQQDSSYVYTPVIMGSAADNAGHQGQSTDCGSGTADAGSGCSDGGGGSN
jgi:uncharacterized membrane protein YgcG